MSEANSVELVNDSASLLIPASLSEGWGLVDLEGWFGATENKVPVTERPQADGAFAASKVLRTSRVVSFRVSHGSYDQATREQGVDELSAFGAKQPVMMIVDGPGGRTARTVTIESTQYLNRTGFEAPVVAVDVIARDPRRYAVSSDVPWQQTGPPTAGNGIVWPLVWPLVWPGGGSSGRVTLTNLGTAPSAPQFRLYGGFSSALITSVETGARIGLDRLVPEGSVVVIDTAEHRATIDGQSDVSRWLRWREWELIPPGESRSYQFDITGAVGTPILEGRVLSAWW